MVQKGWDPESEYGAGKIERSEKKQIRKCNNIKVFRPLSLAIQQDALA